MDQGAVDLEPGRARRNRGLAQPAVDHQDGVRGTGRHRSHSGLTATRLHRDRRHLHRRRLAGARRLRRRPARVRPARLSLPPRRIADRRRHRDPGRGCRRHVHRGGLAPRRRRQSPPRAGCPRRARHGAGARTAVAVTRHPGSGRGVRVARGLPRARNGVSARPHRAGDLGPRRAADPLWRPANGGRSTGAFSAAASRSAPSCWCLRSAGFHSGRS